MAWLKEWAPVITLAGLIVAVAILFWGVYGAVRTDIRELRAETRTEIREIRTEIRTLGAEMRALGDKLHDEIHALATKAHENDKAIGVIQDELRRNANSTP